MLKKILISVLSLLLILTAATGVFRYAVNICDGYLLPEGGTYTEQDLRNAENKTVSYLFSVDSEGAGRPMPSPRPLRGTSSASSGSYSIGASYCVVIGTLIKENKYYYTIYDKAGSSSAYGEFGDSTEQCVIHDIRAASGEIAILCEENGACVLYSISLSNRVGGGAKRILKKAEIALEPEKGTPLKLLLPDEKLEYIAAAYSSGAVLYRTDGQAAQTYEYEPKTVITSGVFYDSTLFLCGAVSGEEDGHGFSYGIAEALGEDGKSLWLKKLFYEGDLISAAMECQQNPNGHLMIYGRYFDYSEADYVMTSLEAARYDDLKIYGHGAHYYIYSDRIRNDEGEAVQSSAFIAELDTEGNEVAMRAYSALNDFHVPSIAQEASLNKLNSKGTFVLTLAQAKTSESTLYTVNIDGVSVTLPANISFYYTTEPDGGIYVYLAESGTGLYKMKYFTSVEEFASGIAALRRALRISDVLDRFPRVLPWIFISAVGTILLIAKHYWREERGNEKNH